MSKKTTEHEKDKRIYQVAEWLLKGISRREDIIQYASKKTNWEVTDRTIDNYLKDARFLIKDTDYADLDLQLKKTLNQLDDLIFKNMSIQDYREVRNCLKAKAELLGLLVDKKEISHSLGNYKAELPVDPD